MSDDGKLVQLGRRREPRLWRDADEFVHGLATTGAEFADDGAPDGWSRRTFMKLLGASVALAALDGCDRTVPEEIVPYSVRPKDVTPGVARSYATAMMLDGFATGLVVECHEGRPTKVEGNPAHPASLGATTMQAQALVLGLYDPDRLRAVEHDGAPSTWEALAERLRRPRADRGRGLRLLLEATTSPTLLRLVDGVRGAHPLAKVTFHQPVSVLANTVAGAQLACGRALQPIYDFGAADVVLVLDDDPLAEGPMATAYARAWAARRRISSPSETPSRLYVVECAPSVTGSCADHRLRRRAGEIAGVARAIAGALPSLGALGGTRDRFTAAVARDLSSRPRGATLVVAGERQPPAVHALALAMNAALGNVGRTVRFVDALLPAGDQDLGALTAEMRSGAVDTLVALDVNPLYDAPADLDFATAMSRVVERIYVGPYANETARASTWIAPSAHAFESWGDGRAWDGTLSLVQPLIQPLHGARTVGEVLAMLAGERQPDARALVMHTHKGLDVDGALAAGLVAGSAAPTVTPAVRDVGAIARALDGASRAAAAGVEISFRRSPTVHDGRFANNGWLLEQPQPTTKLTWDNAVLVSPHTAARLGLHTQDLVDVELGGRRVRGPIFVTPGHADDAVTLDLGWGRQGAESLARGRGFDAYALRTTRALAFAADGQLRRAPGTRELATTQRHFDMHGRPIALAATLAEFRRDPDFTAEQRAPQPSLMPPVKYEGLQWAMSIDLSICTGCSSCMVACQAENNVPIVGKEGVLHRRQMHWIRIDSYFEGSLEDPGVIHQPMLCQHCETAPCEYVCPVNATVHSSDGLNEMVYNRCVGTRFCSNNCPYKVRRFNWFNWHKRVPYNVSAAGPQHNPDVTVRDRGVMEKCSYCVQRIRRAEIRAGNEGRDVKPGEVVTACQQACPTGAIQFASLSHAESPMVKWRNEARSYAVLDDVGTRPRTMYLARITNPNPELG